MNEKRCNNCKYRDLPDGAEPCAGCLGHESWEPEEEQLAEIKRDCYTCKHKDLPVRNNPCFTCDGAYSLWEPKTDEDMVNHPPHYTQGGIECIEAIKAATTGLDGFEAYVTGTAIKYLWRWKHKNGIEDLEKAQWYINQLIEKESVDNG